VPDKVEKRFEPDVHIQYIHTYIHTYIKEMLLGKTVCCGENLCTHLLRVKKFRMREH